MLLAVLLGTAATLLAHGVLVLAGRELAAARSAERLVRLEHHAEAASRRAVGRVADRSLDVASGEEVVVAGTAEGVAWEGALRRLSAEVWLAEGRARERLARRAVVRPFWRLDASTRIESLGSVVVVPPGAGVTGPGRIEAGTFHGPEAAEPAAGCVPAGGPSAPVASLALSAEAAAPALGRLDLARLVAAAPLRVSGSGTPGAEERLGVCVDGLWNWGDPASRRCGGRVVHVALAPGVHVDGGIGQGLLVAEGDVTLSDARLYGFVVAGGTLRLEGVSTLTGMVVARGGIEVGPDARVRGSRCWAAVALGARSLALPLPIPGSGRIRIHR